VKVRRARIEDAEQHVAILKAVAEEERWIGTQAPFDEFERMERLREGLRTGAIEGWMLEEADGRVVGALNLERADYNPGFASLGMMVLADRRGRGGGRRLLDTALAWARDSELRKVGLEVWTDNARAIALYMSAGFEVEGILRDHYRRRDGSLRSTMIMSIFV
jgi:[ribosomal protein S18]-alanine N-acetyltransferase